MNKNNYITAVRCMVELRAESLKRRRAEIGLELKTETHDLRIRHLIEESALLANQQEECEVRLGKI